MVWRDGAVNADAVSDLLQFGRLDRAMLRLFARIPLFTAVLVLGWMTLRRLPFSPGALIAAALRRTFVRRSLHAAVARELAETPGPAVAKVGSVDLSRLGAGQAAPAGEVAVRT